MKDHLFLQHLLHIILRTDQCQFLNLTERYFVSNNIFFKSLKFT